MPESQLREYLRERAKSDLYFLCDAILRDVNNPQTPPLDENVHWDLTENVQRRDVKKKLFLIPRGHLKSTILTVGHSIQTIINNPNTRGLLGSGSNKLAQGFLKEIKEHFEKNELFRWLFPEWESERWEKWNEDLIRAPRELRTSKAKEHTIETAGTEMSLTSRHYDWMKFDDIVNKETVTTKEQMEKTKVWYKTTFSLLEPGGYIDIIGTRWHFNDLYGDIEASPESYIVYKRRAVEDGKPIYPNKYTLEDLQEIRKEQGSYIYSCQYDNNPVDDERAKFKREWIKRYKTLPHRMNYYLTTDLGGDQEGNDFNVLMITGVDEQKNRHTIEFERGHFTPGEFIKLFFMLHRKYQPKKSSIETVAYQKSLLFFMREEMRKQNYFIGITEMKRSKVSKEDRIELRLAPVFENGAYFIGENMKEIEDELTMFPRAKNDDLLDCMADVEELIINLLPEKPKGPEGYYTKTELEDMGVNKMEVRKNK